MTFYPTDAVRVILPKAALLTIFDECDRFDRDETGGRVIGVFQEHGSNFSISVTGIIESGPGAQRTSVSFFQDGAYQERIFRQIERQHPEIEHLGNWHTHHVNGLPRLSGGDIETYLRTVNHRNHNTSFFYAQLVTARNNTSDPLLRYSMKHYLFHRGDDRVYEIPSRYVSIVESPLLWPATPAKPVYRRSLSSPDHEAHPDRVYDRDILAEFYRGIRPFTTKGIGFFWRGPLELLDGSTVEVIVVEDPSTSTPSYSVSLRQPTAILQTIADELGAREFGSARLALLTTERLCNRVLYEQRYQAGR